MKTNPLLIVAGVGILLLITNKGKVKTPKTQPGTGVGGKNNPGNIRNLKGGAKFKGETSADGDSWKSFSSLPYGYRAMIALLRIYHKNGHKTLNKMIARYAPRNENPTNAYIKYVATKTGVDPASDLGDIIFYPDVKNLVGAMSQFEQGKKFVVNQSDLSQAYNLI